MADVPLREYLEREIKRLRDEVRKSERIINERLPNEMASREQLRAVEEKLDDRIGRLERQGAYIVGVATVLATLFNLLVIALIRYLFV